MTLAAEKVASQQGVAKQNFEKAIERMSDQVKRMDHQLAVKVEHSIATGYQNQQNDLRFINMIIERMKETL